MAAGAPDLGKLERHAKMPCPAGEGEWLLKPKLDPTWEGRGEEA